MQQQLNDAKPCLRDWQYRFDIDKPPQFLPTTQLVLEDNAFGI